MSLRKSVNFNLEDGGPKSSPLTNSKIYLQDNFFDLEKGTQTFETLSKPLKIEEDKKVLPIKKLKSVNNIYDFPEYKEEIDLSSSPTIKRLAFKSSKNVSEIKKIQTGKKSYREDINSSTEVNFIKPLESISDSPNSIDESKGNNTTVENIRNYHRYTIESMKKIQNLQIPQEVIKITNMAMDGKKYSDKRFAVFGLEDTLVYYQVNPSTSSFDKILTLPNKTRIGINYRPYLKEALEEINLNYNLIVVSTNEQTIAESVVDSIDPYKQIFLKILYVDYCTNVKIKEEAFYVKDLRMFKSVPINKIVIVDKSVISFAFQISNGIPILPFINSKTDNELKILVTYLNHLSKCEDIQEENRKVFKLDDYLISNDNLDSSGLYHLADSSKDEESDDKKNKSLESDGNIKKIQQIEPIKPIYNFNLNSFRNINNFNSNSSYESNSLLSCLVLLNKGKDYDSVYNTVVSSDFSGVDWEHSWK